MLKEDENFYIFDGEFFTKTEECGRCVGFWIAYFLDINEESFCGTFNNQIRTKVTEYKYGESIYYHIMDLFDYKHTRSLELLFKLSNPNKSYYDETHYKPLSCPFEWKNGTITLKMFLKN